MMDQESTAIAKVMIQVAEGEIRERMESAFMQTIYCCALMIHPDVACCEFGLSLSDGLTMNGKKEAYLCLKVVRSSPPSFPLILPNDIIVSICDSTVFSLDGARRCLYEHLHCSVRIVFFRRSASGSYNSHTVIIPSLQEENGVAEIRESVVGLAL